MCIHLQKKKKAVGKPTDKLSDYLTEVICQTGLKNGKPQVLTRH